LLTCSLDLDGFRAASRRTIGAVRVGVFTASRVAAQEAATYAKETGQFKDRTGNLRKNIKAKFLSATDNGSRWQVISKEQYSRFVEFGTAPHVIRPKAQNGFSGPTLKGQSRRGDRDIGVGRGHALRWNKGGKMFFARLVNHPGTRSYPFMIPALFKAESVLWRELSLLEYNIRDIWK